MLKRMWRESFAAAARFGLNSPSPPPWTASCQSWAAQGGNSMNRMTRTSIMIGAGLALVGGAYAAQQAAKPPALTFSGPVPPQFLIDPQNGSKFGVHDHMTVSAEVAERLAHTCEDFARQHNATATVVILDMAGRIIHEHRMD